MSKKHYNKTRGWLLTEEQVVAVRFYLFLAGIEFKFEARRKLRDGMPKSLVLHEWRKYKEVTSLCADLGDLMPHVYVRA